MPNNHLAQYTQDLLFAGFLYAQVKQLLRRFAWDSSCESTINVGMETASLKGRWRSSRVAKIYWPMGPPTRYDLY